MGADPRLGVGDGVEHPTPLADAANDDPPVHQEEEHGHAAGQRPLRPVVRPGQVVLQMQAGVAQCLLDQRFTMLIVAMKAIGGEAADPLERQVAYG